MTPPTYVPSRNFHQVNLFSYVLEFPSAELDRLGGRIRVLMPVMAVK
jgi:hypothetical protein